MERIALHSTKRSAAVLYAQAAGRDALLRAAGKGRLLEVAAMEPRQPYGLKAWVEAHKAEKPGNDRLQQALDEWVVAFEEEEERRRAAALAAQQEDGWTVVQRHKGRKRNVGSTGVTVAGVAAAAAQAQAAAKQNAAFGDFYRFQQREKRRNGETTCILHLHGCVHTPAFYRCALSLLCLHAVLLYLSTQAPHTAPPPCLQTCSSCARSSRRTSGGWRSSRQRASSSPIECATCHTQVLPTGHVSRTE